MTEQEKEHIIKAMDSVGFAISDLRAIVSSDNVLLAEHAMDMLEVLYKLENKLKRIAF